MNPQGAAATPSSPVDWRPSVLRPTKTFAILLLVWLAEAGGALPAEMQVLERRDLPGGLVREKLRLPGFDPDESVPAVAVHPTLDTGTYRNADFKIGFPCTALAADPARLTVTF
jgi:hypothetical protein